MDKNLSKVLVDESGLAKTIHKVHQDFSIIEFLDFCTFLEGMVLHDKLVLVSQYDKSYVEEAQKSGNTKIRRFEGNDELYQILEKKEIIEHSSMKPPKYNLQQRPNEHEKERLLEGLSSNRRNRNHSPHRRRMQNSIIKDSWYEAERLTNAQQFSL